VAEEAWFSVAKTVGVSFGSVNGKLVKVMGKSESWATLASYIALLIHSYPNPMILALLKPPLRTVSFRVVSTLLSLSSIAFPLFSCLRTKTMYASHLFFPHFPFPFIN